MPSPNVKTQRLDCSQEYEGEGGWQYEGIITFVLLQSPLAWRLLVHP